MDTTIQDAPEGARRIYEQAPTGGSEAPELPEFGPSGRPRSGGGLDSYRVTHERSGEPASDDAQPGWVTQGEVAESEPDCPYPIEIGVDEWDKETGELVDTGIQLIPCGRKGCPVCGPKVRDRYVAHFSRVFADLSDDRPIWFLTLTVDPKVIPDDATEIEARKYLTHCWDKYAKRLRYRAEDLKYAGSFEKHEDGRYHLHVLVAADFPRCDREAQTREMMRVQWFESGGGAVGKVKRIREGRTEPAEDGRPDGVAGACGYVVKYAFKDAAEAHSEAESRRSLIASEGIGYHSEAAKERRRERAEEASGEDSPVETEYRSLVTRKASEVGESGGRVDTLTEEDRARFEEWDRDVRTVEYTERVEDAEPWDGRDVWIVWRMEADAGELRRTVYDGHPESRDATVLELDRRVSREDP